MGDVGSILLGFVFSALAVWLSNSILELICLSSFLFPFYADEITTEIVRLKNREKIWTPHRLHLYQILTNEFKIVHWKITVGYGSVQIVVGVSSLLALKAGAIAVIMTLGGYFAIFCLVSGAVRKQLAKNAYKIGKLESYARNES